MFIFIVTIFIEGFVWVLGLDCWCFKCICWYIIIGGCGQFILFYFDCLWVSEVCVFVVVVEW